MSKEFVGRGWGFPLRTDATGSIALVSRDQEIEEAIKLILMTTPGERPMRPSFGCRIRDFIFASADSTTAGEIEFEVRRALTRWEPRIDIHSVEVLFDSEDTSVLYVDIRYLIKATNDPRNLVFPFYTIPPEEEQPTPEELAAQVEMISEE
jgi:phage baseplate assembly protein W